MTVKGIKGDQVDCFWTDVNGQIDADSFPSACSRWGNSASRRAMSPEPGSDPPTMGARDHSLSVGTFGRGHVITTHVTHQPKASVASNPTPATVTAKRKL